MKFCKLNPFEAKLRMASLYYNKIYANDSLKLELLGVTQLAQIKSRGRQYMSSKYTALRFLALQYQKMIKERNKLKINCSLL